MRSPEEELIAILKKAKVDFTSSLPCEKIKGLLRRVPEEFFHLPLTREEEGVGISAGAALSGKRPAMFVQSSGVGNMINALLSLTGFYQLPLAIFVSWRGVYKERIEAQLPMGQNLPGILKGAGISHSPITTREDLEGSSKRLEAVYKKNTLHAFLLSPALWEGSAVRREKPEKRSHKREAGADYEGGIMQRISSPRLTRFEILNSIAPYLDSKVVVCNLGIPSKELYFIKDQPSNFYMLGSMGMATPIGLGIALTSDKEVVVIDGDGSILMNPGTLATAASCEPKNLTILAIDNSSYGSTGDQPTLTGMCVDLEFLARGFGIKDTHTVSRKKELVDMLKRTHDGMRFIHVLAVPGNRDVPNIPLHHLAIKERVQGFLRR
ncbi:MAG TPA: sulfopyruvate decarboxylase subunit beta [Thermodesulfovibrionales bacterium]|nr:sulfopyruvate decarboxylase subunit beta [Thermodesulfovibrionales bacterium]